MATAPAVELAALKGNRIKGSKMRSLRRFWFRLGYLHLGKGKAAAADPKSLSRTTINQIGRLSCEPLSRPNAFKCEIIFHPVLVENHMAPGPKEPAKVMQCLWDSRSRPSGPWCFSFRLWSGAVDEHDEHFYIFPFVPRIYDLDMLICADLYDALSCDLCKLI